MKLLFATNNPGKLREAAEILGDGFELWTPAEAGVNEEIPETGNTIEENSLQKALYIYGKTGADCFADDTGLEVECLGGAPGVHTARYGGPSRSFDANMDRLLSEMAKVDEDHGRRAQFRTCVTLVLRGEVHRFEGVMKGTIATSKAGCGGFGYDPVFIPDEAGGKLTAAEISEEEKNAISHRGKALRKMSDWLRARLAGEQPAEP